MLFSLLHVTLGKSHALSGSQFVHLQKEGDEVRSLQTFLAPSPHGSGMQLFPPGWRRERERDSVELSNLPGDRSHCSLLHGCSQHLVPRAAVKETGATALSFTAALGTRCWEQGSCAWIPWRQLWAAGSHAICPQW